MQGIRAQFMGIIINEFSKIQKFLTYFWNLNHLHFKFQSVILKMFSYLRKLNEIKAIKAVLKLIIHCILIQRAAQSQTKVQNIKLCLLSSLNHIQHIIHFLSQNIHKIPFHSTDMLLQKKYPYVYRYIKMSPMCVHIEE